MMDAEVAAMVRASLLLSLALISCTTVGPGGTDEQWRVVSMPGGGVVSTSFGASCRTPCNVRIPDEAFEIAIEREGYAHWAARYDPAQPNALQALAPAPNRAANAAAGAALAGGQMAAAGGGLAGATAVGGAAVLGALLWMLGPRVRRLEVRLEPQA